MMGSGQRAWDTLETPNRRVEPLRKDSKTLPRALQKHSENREESLVVVVVVVVVVIGIART